jgi:O-antigen ligase
LPSGVLPNANLAFQDTAKLAILVFLLLNLIRTPQEFRIFVNVLLLCTCYLAFYSIKLYLSGMGFNEHGLERSITTGIFGDPNDLAMTIIPGLALSLFGVIKARGLARYLNLGLTALMLWAIFLTSSRGGMLSLLTVVIGSCLLYLKNKRVAVIIAVIAAMGLLAIGSGSRMINFDSSEDSADARFGFWDNGLSLLTASPLFGVGYQKFADNNNGRAAHNTFVQCFAELGLPGYFFWMGCIYYAFRRYRNRAENETAVAVLKYLPVCRLAITAYLVGAFWLSRAFIPITFLIFTLPLLAVKVADPSEDVFLLSKDESRKDLKRIASITLGSILFIFVLVQYHIHTH